jgi:cell wall-associated NlpC family hydrolase
MSSVSGLSPKHRSVARKLMMNALLIGYSHASQVHYTQDLKKRWQWKKADLKAYRGEFPRYVDCSSFATWAIWNGLSHYGVRDTVNGLAWNAGYTGTMLKHGKRVNSSRNWKRGDCFIYGSGWPGKHVAVYIGGGYVISHGSEGGPYKVRWNYRPDLMEVRRYI